MKCKICGAESGTDPVCQSCAQKEETEGTAGEVFMYKARKALISRNESAFFTAISDSLPEGFHLFPQVNLASFVDRTDDPKYRNELFRNVDFLITDAQFAPRIAVEINDQTHLESKRKTRDEKVRNILEEAGIPLLTLWTSYGVNKPYIEKRIGELLSAPIIRKHHFEIPSHPSGKQSASASRKGCYIATCVYGSYDCPEVWVLRRYRDGRLSATRPGRAFIRGYYAVSPALVKWFGGFRAFRRCARKLLDRLVTRLLSSGYDNTPYSD